MVVTGHLNNIAPASKEIVNVFGARKLSLTFVVTML